MNTNHNSQRINAATSNNENGRSTSANQHQALEADFQEVQRHFRQQVYGESEARVVEELTKGGTNSQRSNNPPLAETSSPEKGPEAVQALHDFVQLNLQPDKERELPHGLLPLLIGAWPHFSGCSQTRMAQRKLDRFETVVWSSPHLSLTIERHGAAKFGSSRAEMQTWTLDFDSMTAAPYSTGYRQLTKRDEPLDTKALAVKVARAIRKHSNTPSLVWKCNSEVKVQIGDVIPATYAQTTQGRRKRFRGHLTEQLAQIGWVPSGAPQRWLFKNISGTTSDPSIGDLNRGDSIPRDADATNDHTPTASTEQSTVRLKNSIQEVISEQN